MDWIGKAAARLGLDDLRPTPSFPGYAATYCGRIVSSYTFDFMCPTVDTSKGPYRILKVTRGGKRRHVKVHILVADAFLPRRPSRRHIVRHRDGNPSNNWASNLMWGTLKQNSADAREHGTAPVGERNPAAKLNIQKVREIRSALKAGMTRREVAAIYQVDSYTIGDIDRRDTWRHV